MEEEKLEIEEKENEEVVSDEDLSNPPLTDEGADAEKGEIVPPSVEPPIDVVIPDAVDEDTDLIQTVTVIDTPAGTMSVVHDITLGDLIISTILMAHLIFIVLYKLIRRY